MNLTSLAILILLPASGGVIAYFADRLGRILGKKRLSLFGLRPRHTAEVLTVGAGVLVPLITILTILIASRDVRQWLLEGPRLIAQRDAALADIKKAESDRKVAEDASLGAQKRLQAVLIDLKSTSARYQSLNAEFTKLTSSYRNLTEQYRKVAKDFSLAKSRLASLETQQAKLEATYAALQTSYKALSAQQQEQLEQNRKLLDENEKVSQEVEVSKQTVSKYRTEIDTAQRNLAAAKKNLADTLSELSSVKDSLDKMRVLKDSFAQELGSNIRISRLSPIIYNVAEEVARVTIPPNLTDAQAQAYVDKLMAAASDAALARGAQASEDGSSPIALFPLIDDKGLRVTAQEKERAFAAQIAGRNVDQLIVAYAAVNGFAGEPVRVALRQFDNPVVYHDHQTIAVARFNGRLSETEIYEQLTDFLQKDVHDRAKKDNMILVVSTREPAVQITMSEVMNLVHVIKLQNKPVTLYAEADGETRAAGPLKLQFRLP